MNCKIKFINHASFSIEWDNDLLLMDPWYSGRIFNNSWSLLRDTKISEIEGIEKLSKIVISHEHPDHLHWGTLKQIKEYLPDNNITIYLPYRNNDNVKIALKKLGFNFSYLQPNLKTFINDSLTLCTFPTGHDSAVVFEIDDKVLLNQNDAYLTDSEVNVLTSMYPSIDYWWMQFSLAGYYANKANKKLLKEKGHNFHIERFQYYKSKFNPKVTIPFASFCYFCKYYNSYLNDYVVKPSHLLELDNNITPLFYNDHISNPDKDAIDKWEYVYKEKRVIDPKPKTHSLDEISSAALSMFQQNKDVLSKIPNQYKPSGYFIFYDHPRTSKTPFHSVYLDFENETLKVSRTLIPKKHEIAGITSSEEFVSFLKVPWGADTLNITGCFEKINEQLWNNILIFKDQLYTR